MTWRDRLQKASFRGVTFHVEGVSAPKGRRVPVRRLAGKDGAVPQDLGRDADTHDIEAFLFGDDYDVEREALEKALMLPGPAELILPKRGALWGRVIRGPVTTETRRDGGYCTIRFSVLIEERKGKGLTSAISSSASLVKAAKSIADLAETDMTDTFDVAGLPGKYISKVTSAIGSVTDTLRTVQGKINGVLNPLEDLTAEIDNFSSSVAGILNTPNALATRMVALVQSVYALADVTRDAKDRTTGLSLAPLSPYDRALAVRTTHSTAKDMNDMGRSEPGSANTDLADRNAKNVRAVYRAARAAAIGRQSETLATSPFDSATFALTVMTQAIDEIDAIQAYSCGDELFYGLADLRAALARHLAVTAASLPKTVTREQHPCVPALLLAHVLYGDSRQDSEILARNSDQHPLWLEGELEVLSA